MTNTIERAEARIMDALENESDNLDLSGLDLKVLPESICQLTQLTELNLEGNQLTTLPESVCHLTKLIALYLGGNQLTTLPESVCQLTQLTSLHLYNNQLTTLPKSVCHLTHLTVLDLGSNQLTTLPESVCQLTQLTGLYLVSNQLTTLPESVCQLIQLTTLDLFNNQLTSLPESVCQLTQLTTLYLKDNQLTTLPESVCRLTQLTRLDLRNNQLVTPPQAVAEEGIEAIRRWFEQRKVQGEVEVKSTKVMLLGPPEVGKTTLRIKLIDSNMTLPGPEDRTVGVEISSLPIPLDDDSQGIARLFDFGGQQIQYFAHHFFLSPDAFHILMINYTVQLEQVDYWLKCIREINSQPQAVLPIYNIFANTSAFTCSQLLEDNHCLDHIKVDLVNGKPQRIASALAQIKEEIKEHIQQQSKSILTKWLAIQEHLVAMTQPYITIKEYRDICASPPFELNNEDYQDDLLKYLHKLGHILHFGAIASGYVFLNSNWIIKAIYTLFKPANTLVVDGHFTRTALLKAWSVADESINRPAYAEQDRFILFDLLLRSRFNICHPNPQQGDDTYFIPHYFSSTPRKQGWLKIHQSYTGEVSLRHIQMQFVPCGLMAQLIVQMQPWLYCSDSQYAQWAHGMVLNMESAWALVEQNKSEAYGQHISIEVIGPLNSRKRLQRFVLTKIEEILATNFRYISFEVYTPCLGCIDKNQSGHRYFTYDKQRVCPECSTERHFPPEEQERNVTKNITYHITLNDNASIGNLNTGIQKHINKIESNLVQLNDNNGVETAKALQELSQAIVNANGLNDDKKNESLELVETLSAQASLPKEERQSFNKTLIQGLESCIKTANDVYAVWEKWQPVIMSIAS